MPSIAQLIAKNQELESSGKKVYSVEPAPTPVSGAHSPDEFSGAVGAPVRATIDSIIMPTSPQWQKNSPLSGKGTTMRTGGIPLGALPTTQNNSAQQTAQLESAAASAQKAINDIADAVVLSTNSSGTVTSGSFGSAPRRHVGRQAVIPLDNIADGPSFGKVVQTALTTNQPDLAQLGVINKTLRYVTDDQTTTGRFASTVSGLSYRTTTNPLTATDAGSSATINLASFNLRTRNTSVAADISYNSGSIASLSYGTLYYVYTSDPNLLGGTPAGGYQVTTTKETTLSGAGNLFLGSVITPVATTPDTIGNNDAGAGGQSGSLSLLSFLTPGSGVTGNGAVANPTNSIDGDLTTFAQLTVTGNSGSNSAVLQPTQLPAVLNRYYSVTLKIAYSVPTNTLNGSAGPNSGLIVTYTFGGITHTAFSVAPGVTAPLTVASISVDLYQNLSAYGGAVHFTNITLAASAGQTTGTAAVNIYGIWVEGTN